MPVGPVRWVSVRDVPPVVDNQPHLSVSELIA